MTYRIKNSLKNISAYFALSASIIALANVNSLYATDAQEEQEKELNNNVSSLNSSDQDLKSLLTLMTLSLLNASDVQEEEEGEEEEETNNNVSSLNHSDQDFYEEDSEKDDDLFFLTHDERSKLTESMKKFYRQNNRAHLLKFSSIERVFNSLSKALSPEEIQEIPNDMLFSYIQRNSFKEGIEDIRNIFYVKKLEELENPSVQKILPLISGIFEKSEVSIFINDRCGQIEKRHLGALAGIDNLSLRCQLSYDGNEYPLMFDNIDLSQSTTEDEVFNHLENAPYKKSLRLTKEKLADQEVAHFLFLPAEVHYEISAYLSHGDLKNLFTVCGGGIFETALIERSTIKPSYSNLNLFNFRKFLHLGKKFSVSSGAFLEKKFPFELISEAEELYIEGMNFSDKDMKNLDKLKSLSLKSCCIETLKKLPSNIKTLSIHSAQRKSPCLDFESVEHLESIKLEDLSASKLSLKNLPRLQSLALDSFVTREFSLRGVPNLSSVTLDKPKGYGHSFLLSKIWEIGSITSLDMGQVIFPSRESFAGLLNFPKLESLRINGWDINSHYDHLPTFSLTGEELENLSNEDLEALNEAFRRDQQQGLTQGEGPILKQLEKKGVAVDFSRTRQ